MLMLMPCISWSALRFLTASLYDVVTSAVTSGEGQETGMFSWTLDWRWSRIKVMFTKALVYWVKKILLRTPQLTYCTKGVWGELLRL